MPFEGHPPQERRPFSSVSMPSRFRSTETSLATRTSLEDQHDYSADGGPEAATGAATNKTAIMSRTGTRAIRFIGYLIRRSPQTSIGRSTGTPPGTPHITALMGGWRRRQKPSKCRLWARVSCRVSLPRRRLRSVAWSGSRPRLIPLGRITLPRTGNRHHCSTPTCARRSIQRCAVEPAMAQMAQLGTDRGFPSVRRRARR